MALSITTDPNPRPPAISAADSAFSPKAPLSTGELVQVARALETLMGVADALTQRGGFHDDRSRRNSAGRRFEKIADRICDEYLEVMSELRDSRPRTEREEEDRSCELLAFDLNCDADPTDVALGAVRRAFPGRY